MKVIVNEYEKGLLFEKGRLVRVLGPGLHRVRRLFRRQRIETVDMRIRTLQIAGQEIMTADKVTLRMNVLVKFKVVDPEAALMKVEDYLTQIYGDTQMALRSAVAAQSLDELLVSKAAIGPRVRQSIVETVAEYGVEVREVGVKDMILPGDMKAILNQVIEAKKRSEAAVIERREEIAAIRSQANTAQLYERNPMLYRLKELESLEKILGAPGRTIVLGSPDELLASVLRKNEKKE